MVFLDSDDLTVTVTKSNQQPASASVVMLTLTPVREKQRNNTSDTTLHM